MKQLSKALLLLCMGALLTGCQKVDQGITGGQVRQTEETMRHTGRETMETDRTSMETKYAETKSTKTAGRSGLAGFDQSIFKGKVKAVEYAASGDALVYADQLYLYNLTSGAVEASTDMDAFREVSFVRCDKGYGAIGVLDRASETASLGTISEGSWICVLYNEKLEEVKRVNLSEHLSDDMIISSTEIALSESGAKIAWASLQGIYIMDLKSEKVDKVLDYSAQSSNGKTEFAGISFLSFVSNGTKLAFLGDYMPSTNAGAESVKCYGTLSLDGSNLVVKQQGDYEPEEMIAYETFMLLPENFDKADGTLMSYEYKNGAESYISFQNSSEGKDGVFSSAGANYIATAVLNDKDMVVRIYDRESRKLLKEETISGLEETYYYRIPQIRIFEESKSCVVLLGRGQQDLESKMVTLEF